MITENERNMVKHEMESCGKDWVLLRFKGWQPGAGSVPGRALWNVVAGSYTHNSTVTIETMLANGYRVEVVK